MIGYVVNALFLIMTGVKHAKNVIKLGLVVITFRGLQIGNVQGVAI
jgi:hypothetical protein